MQENIVILNFSPRSNGNCRNVSEFIADAHNRTNVLQYHMVRDDFQPCGDCDYECLKPGVCCPSVTQKQKDIMDSICNSDLVYYIIPNFCGYPCSSFFAYNERSVGYFNMDRELMGKYMAVQKKFIIISNTENDNFLHAAKTQTKEQPQILYLKTSKYGKRSIAGDILESDEAKVDLNRFLEYGTVNP